MYMASPARSYVIQQEKKLDYAKFEEDPLQFYEEAINSKVTKTCIKREPAASTTPKTARKPPKSTNKTPADKENKKSRSVSREASVAKKSKLRSRRNDTDVFTVSQKQGSKVPHKKIGEVIKKKI